MNSNRIIEIPRFKCLKSKTIRETTNRNQMTRNVYPRILWKIHFRFTSGIFENSISQKCPNVHIGVFWSWAYLLSLGFLDHLITCDQGGCQVEASIFIDATMERLLQLVHICEFDTIRFLFFFYVR